MDFKKIRIGCVVSVMTDDGVYRGTVQSVDPNGNKLSLTKITEEPSKKTIYGLIHFYRGEIQALKILESPNPETRGPSTNSDDQMVSEEANLANGINFANGAESAEAVEGGVVNEEYKWISKSTFIDSTGDDYKSAIKSISEMHYIGVSLNGDNISRTGKLSLICVGTVNHIFLFDILTMGDEAVEMGLGEILENPNIVKIFHDCRMPSDCLYHRYGVSLNNVFDTQIADALIHQERHEGELPKTVKSLFECVQEYLDLYHHQIQIPSVWNSASKREGKTWLIRPLPESYAEAAVSGVCYLRDLQKMCVKLMLSRFTAGVNLYLNIIRDSEEEEAAARQSRLHLLPEQVKNLKTASNKGLIRL